MLRTLVCESDNSFSEVDDPSTISDLLHDRRRHIWLDLEAPTEDDFRMIAEEFNLHPLALEDAHMQHQRPKVEQYEGFYFVVFYSVDIIDPEKGEVPSGRSGWETKETAHHDEQNETAPIARRSGSLLASRALRRVDELSEKIAERVILRELAMFMGSNYLITVHKDPIPELAEAERRWRANAKSMVSRAGNGSPSTNGRPAGRPNLAGNETETPADDIGILLYSLLDSIVDDYFPVIDSIVERVEDLEEQIFEHFDESALQSIFTLKKDLLVLRKVLGPERDVLNIITRRDLPIFNNSTIIYFQDIYDHVVRITESIDTYRDLLSSALDSYLSMQSNRLNITLKTLTSASIILMSMTLVAGIYGMNFDFMPELHWILGYPFALGLMAAIAIVLYFYFRRKGWL